MKTLIKLAQPHVLLALITGIFLSMTLHAEEMTAERFVAMDLEARDVTLEGVKNRLFVLQQVRGDMPAQMREDNLTQQEVNEVYARYGTTAAKAVAWSTQHAEWIQKWLSQHTEVQEEYERIAKELDKVSDQIQALAN